jgi:energy-coupling factor transporter ATP-binding protein EcfA2
MPRGFDLADLEAAATVLEWKDGHFLNCLLGPKALPLRIDAPPAAPLAAALIRKLGELSKNVRRVQVPFHRIAPAASDYWSTDSRAFVEVPLGRAGATKLQHLRLGVGTSQHVLIAGKTGSGKSTLLNVIVTDLALRYSPDEIEFYLIDFKKGVEFKTYATHKLPHARVVSIESDREFGTSVLERLDTVLKERGNLFRQEAVQDIKAFRDARPDVRLPRILLIVDEFQEFFVEDDRYSQAAALLLDRLVRQGRAFGIHVLLGSQSLGGAYSLARTTVGQMAIRIALQCSEADAHLILSEENSAARLLTRPGEAIYNDANGLVEGNSPFQVAWLDDDERDTYLAQINDLAVERGMSWPEPIVFEGNVPADPARNNAFCELVESSAGEQADENGAETAPHVWVGDAVAITGPSLVTFARRSGSNLLIVGQDQDAAFGMLANSLVALSAQWRGTRQDSDSGPQGLYLFAGESSAGKTGRWAPIIAALPQPPKISGPADAGGVLAEIAAEVVRRQERRAPARSIFLLIDDLSRFRDLRKAEEDFGFGSSDRDKRVTPGQLLADVLRDGPEVGVHVVVWCDSCNNLDRWFSRQSLREFDRRIAMQMSSNDSSSLIDSPAASRLGAHRALLYSDEQGTAEKFRPYGPPSDEWLEGLSRDPHPETEPEELGVADDINQWVVT